jgi:hypothetical protein
VILKIRTVYHRVLYCCISSYMSDDMLVRRASTPTDHRDVRPPIRSPIDRSGPKRKFSWMQGLGQLTAVIPSNAIQSCRMMLRCCHGRSRQPHPVRIDYGIAPHNVRLQGFWIRTSSPRGNAGEYPSYRLPGQSYGYVDVWVAVKPGLDIFEISDISNCQPLRRWTNI